MIIRFAQEKDIEDIEKLLVQICNVHSKQRPDLFKNDGQKYDKNQIKEIISDKTKPVIVAYDEENERVIGYAMCIFKISKADTAMCDMKTLYLDDLCVDESYRGRGIGRKIYDYLIEYAKKEDCYNITLNVWEGNKGAKKFYNKCGLTIQKTTLEKIL